MLPASARKLRQERVAASPGGPRKGMRFSRQARFLERERRDPFIESQWQAVLPFAWQADTRAPMDLEQLLIEVGDRAENYYEALWQSCSTSERLVLGHVAKERLINEKCSRIVRGLMVRGLVDRQPNFDVMNETFRRFVSARPFDEDVVGLETRRSTWPGRLPPANRRQTADELSSRHPRVIWRILLPEPQNGLCRLDLVRCKNSTAGE